MPTGTCGCPRCHGIMDVIDRHAVCGRCRYEMTLSRPVKQAPLPVSEPESGEDDDE